MNRFACILLAIRVFLIFPVLTIALLVPEERGQADKRTEVHTGIGTYYTPDSNLGACGWKIKNTDPSVAMSSEVFDGSNCGKTIQIDYGGYSVTVTVADSCSGCDPNHLDMTSSVFQTFAPLSQGVLQNIKWHYLD